MGTMLFLVASGLTLVFGLMDVLNFAHGAFITLGAFLAVSVFGHLAGWVGADEFRTQSQSRRVGAALGGGRAASGAAGFGFERLSFAASMVRICDRSLSPSVR